MIFWKQVFMQTIYNIKKKSKILAILNKYKNIFDNFINNLYINF